MKDSIMKKFIKSKWLFDEFIIFKYNQERVYTYIPNWSKELQKERNEDIVRMRAEWKTLREIGDKKWISYEMVRLIIKRNTK